MRYWQLENSVQSCSNDKNIVPNATEITEKEFDAFIAALPTPEPQPEPADELALLKQQYAELKAKVDKTEADIGELKKAKK